jgi:glycosyltransferase involved in cell wall biosynthesis
MLVTAARFQYACTSMSSAYAVCFDGRLCRELSAAGSPVTILGDVRTRYPRSVWRARRKLQVLLREQGFDVVVCHMPWAQAIFGPVVRAERIPLVFQSHSPVTGRHWLERWAALTRPDMVLCLSRFLAENVRNLYPDVPVEVVYNPVAPVLPLNEGERLALRMGVNTPADAVVIVQACRIEGGKGHKILLEALALLRDLPYWECWQVGGPQESAEHHLFNELKEQAQRLRITDRVRFWGWRTDVPCLLAASDIYCQPNDTYPEGLPNVMVEAMYAGLPVVTTTCVGAAPEFLDHNCSLVVPPRDPAPVAMALRKLIQDRGLRARLGASGRAKACQMFAPSVQIPRFHEALAAISSKQPAGLYS